MRIERDVAITETAGEAAVIGIGAMRRYTEANEGTKVPRTRVLQAITPKEGDAVFWWREHWQDIGSPEYTASIQDTDDGVMLKANALTIGKTVGELRALLTWAQG